MLRLPLVCLLVATAWFSAAQAQTEEDVARETLRALQEKSVRSNREYCGLIWRDAAGRLVAGEAVRGGRARCRYPYPPAGVVVVATYHTHGSFLESYDNEVPSVLDVLAELGTRTRGYVSTPGGRFWVIDGHTGDVRQICGPKCLPWDARFVPGLVGPVAGKYTLDQLKSRQLSR